MPKLNGYANSALDERSFDPGQHCMGNTEIADIAFTAKTARNLFKMCKNIVYHENNCNCCHQM